jgi:hypothetical protein
MDPISLGFASLILLLLVIVGWSFRTQVKSAPRLGDAVELTREGVADQKRIVKLLEDLVALQRDTNRLLLELSKKERS